MGRVEKQEFKNNTGGHLGVVVIGPKGDDTGATVPPDGTVWLSEEEQVLTANAPRRAEDNPFVPQTLQRINPETGEAEDFEVTPLTRTNSNRLVPAQQRPIPADISDAAATGIAQDAATGDTPEQPTAASDPVAARQREVREQGETAQPGGRAVPPQQAVAGARARAAAEAAQTAPAAPQTPPAAPTPEEETAAASPGPQAEETGAATPPSGAAPTGEFKAGEEVGTPTSPEENAAAVERQATPPQQPGLAPTPGSQPEQPPAENGVQGEGDTPSSEE